MEKIAPFGKQRSDGTFDDLYNPEKFESIEAARAANDFVRMDFMRDEKGLIFIEASNAKNPNTKKLYKLEVQNFRAGLDHIDDQNACEIAKTLL